MPDDRDFHALDVELARVVDRLGSLPLQRAASAADACQEMAQVLLDATRALAAEVPSDVALPRLAPQGLGAMIAVLGRDYRDAARASSAADLGPVLDALVGLRRALP